MNSINFLAHQGESFLDKFIQWTLSYGRAIVMVTEFIALLAFLYRFGLDQSLVDLNDQIKQQSAIITHSAQQQDTYLNLQKRLSLAKQLDTQATTILTQFSDIINQANGNVTFSSVAITPGSLQATLTTNSTTRLNTFLQDVKNLPRVVSVNVGSVENKVSIGQITASITVALQSESTTNQTSQ